VYALLICLDHPGVNIFTDDQSFAVIGNIICKNPAAGTAGYIG
jgi:hypothetical protein